jgi:hypothetical protein
MNDYLLGLKSYKYEENIFNLIHSRISSFIDNQFFKSKRVVGGC